ncbi:MAG: cell division protein ZapD [Gammaproteobacteria bacterium]|nr:cell division protein ZapD [Gammaproteobacteria bacterium]
MQSKMIIYEQPLNEYLRVCLRLEHLFACAKHYLNKQNEWDTRTAIATIIDVLNVFDRPDIKSKLTNAVHSHMAALSAMQQAPNIDNAKLQQLLQQLNSALNMLGKTEGKLGQTIRNHEFLAMIKQRLSVPGGTCNSVMPNYQLWLKQPFSEQQTILEDWLNSLTPLQRLTDLLLKLTRESAKPVLKIASNGFYQEMLAPQIAYQLIRVAVPKESNLYPEISVGRHCISIYFYQFNLNARSTQTTEEVSFELSCCKI